MREHDDLDEADYEAEQAEQEAAREAARKKHEHDQAVKGDRREAHQFAQDAFKKSADALANAQVGETKKVFGLFEMDAAAIAYFNTIYNMGADYLSHKLAPKAAEYVERYGGKVGIPDSKLKLAAGLAHIGSTVAFKAGGYVGPLWEGFSKQRTERSELARRLSPVLNDLKGNHSVGALYSVKQNENEVIFAHRKRMAKITSTTNFDNTLDLMMNAGANMVLDFKGFAATLKHGRVVTAQELAQQQAQKQQELQVKAEAGEASQGRFIMSGALNTTVPQLVQHLQKTSKHKLKKALQPYSALEMILELNEQVTSNPEARAFDEPRGFNASSSRREQYPLEEYLMRICIQHQKDMADINPEHSEIREALKDDLAAAIKPLATAIRKGDMSVLSLVRLVGEGKIIKKHGRAVAHAEDVSALIAKEAPKQKEYAQVDPAEYYKDAAFSRDQLKAALKGLEGDEKTSFAAMFPDSVLAEAGMSKKEIKQVRLATLKSYDKLLCEAVIGLAANSDEQLDKKGLAKNEIKIIRDAMEKIETHGLAAMHDLKTSPVRENGIEHLLTNVVVHQPKYLGTMIKDGRKQFAEVAANDSGKSFSKREGKRREEDVANDDFAQGVGNGR